jgi:dihydrofolate synthase / folylpolyglutamate synthase
MNYQQTLDYLFKSLPMYQRIGAAAYKADLNNTIAICAHLGNPERSFKTIHVAGTNGKGSVSHFIAAMLQAAGYKTGLYTSPHYVDFRERIKINGQYLSPKKVVGFVAQHQAFLEQLKPSFFEMTVGLAFDYFREQEVDFAVIETGLGGRLDSTNVISPELCVITNISYDHMALLGNTLPLIAAEKAGIIKAGVPVVIGERQTDAIWQVFETKAESVGAPLICAEQTLSVTRRASPQPGHMEVDITPLQPTSPTKAGLLRLRQISPLASLQVSVTGAYQLKNLQTAMAAVGVLNEGILAEGDRKITETHIRAAFKDLYGTVRFMGRLQFLGENPTVLCDSAHNEAGLTYLFQELKQMQYARLHLVCGFANDKDLGGILPLFPAEATYYFAKANVPRGLDAQTLKATAAPFGLHGKAYRSVRRALAAARKSAQPNDLILVTGSIFVLGEVVI